MRRCLPAQALVKLSLALFVTLVAMVTTLRSEPRRLGLVIGISGYDHLPRLPKTLEDADKIGKALEAANPKFDVTYSEDVDWNALNQVVKNFVATIQPGDVVVVYFAGHGVQAGN